MGHAVSRSQEAGLRRTVSNAVSAAPTTAASGPSSNGRTSPCAARVRRKIRVQATTVIVTGALTSVFRRARSSNRPGGRAGPEAALPAQLLDCRPLQVTL